MNGPRYPDTFLCGAPKCATTTLTRALDGHDRIFVPAVKEPSYFAPDYLGEASLIGDDVRAYLALYAKARADQRLLDASVNYLFSGTAIAAILEHVPDARFICVFRQPLDLFLSWHAHLVRFDLQNEPDAERAWHLVAEREAGAHLPPGLRCRSSSTMCGSARSAPNAEGSSILPAKNAC